MPALIRRKAITILLAVLAVSSAAAYYSISAPPTKPDGVTRKRLIISTTTSLFDTGLLDVLEDDFESKYPYDLSFISVGTGLAILHAERGDADAILVHAPTKEFDFLKDGYGVARKIVAYNFFVIVGPPDDPAAVSGQNVIDALERIVDAGRQGRAVWVSRGDDSGTHTKEKGLWRAAGHDASNLRDEPWYIEAGTGMGSTLRLANEKQAYTLSDIGTYLKYKADGAIRLNALVKKGEKLLNVYSAIAVNPDKVSGVNFNGAVIFIEYLVSEETQRLIGDFGRETFQKPLFTPAVDLLRTASDIEVSRWISEYAFLDGSECPPQYRGGQDQLYR